MQLTHVAIWTNDLERLRAFYVKYFNGRSNVIGSGPVCRTDLADRGFLTYPDQ